MRVLYLPVVDSGGASNSFKEVILNLSKNNNVEPIIIVKNKGSIYNFAIENKFEVHVIDYDDFYICSGSTKLKKFIKWMIRPVLKIKYRIKKVVALKKISKAVALDSIDLIHTNLNRTDIGIELAKKYNIPNIMHIREFGELDYECISLKSNYINYLNNNVSKFIAISKSVANYWVNKGLNDSLVEVIYNGVNENQFIIPKKKNNDKVKIAFCGTIIPNKGQIQAIEAVSILPDNLKNKIELHFFGTSKVDYQLFLNNRIETKKLNNIIFFEGQCNNLNEILPSFDVGLTCSKSEGFGRVTVEYMMSNLCVIASNTGANIELIDENNTGLLYEYNDYNDLSKKIAEIVENEKLRKKIAINGLNMATSRFTSLNNSENISKLYLKLIN